MEDKIIFQIDSAAVKEAFLLDNFIIEYNDEFEIKENNLCVIYFSSNEIYYPNTVKSFEYSILKRDKYEWKRNKFPQARKHIFLRDLHKQWYLSGINESLNNPLKILDFLKAETMGYRVITIGSSAGGYAALLYGSLLECERIYAFNAQMNLRVTMKNSNPLTDPILFALQNDDNLTSYFDLSNFLSPKTDNYYFQSCYSKMDLDQLDGINKEAQNKLKIIRFRTSNHGFPFLRINLKNVLSFSSSKLYQYSNKTIHPIIFSFQLIGIIPTLSFVLKALKERYQKKLLESNLKSNISIKK
jgi:hypothetical protein